jgi:hypothetical protein
VIQTPFCKEIKTLDHEGQEIKSVEELVNRYYHSPQEYFRFNGSMDNDKMAVATAVTNNILYGYQVIQNQLSKNNFDKNAFEISHFQNAKITIEFQKSQYNNIKKYNRRFRRNKKFERCPKYRAISYFSTLLL